MNSFKYSRFVCMQNFRKWSSNYKIWCLAVVISIFVFNYIGEIADFSRYVNEEVTPWSYPFLFTHDGLKILILLGIVLMFCDVPFIDENQPYIIVRSGRKAWSIGQIIYITATSLIYNLYLVTLSILFSISNIKLEWDWGKALGTLAYTNAGDDLNLVISGRIISFFTPLQEMWFTFLLNFLLILFLGLLIYVINIWSNSKVLGITVAVFFILLDKFIHAFDFIKASWFSPVTWGDLSYIDIGGTSSKPTIVYILITYFLLIFILSIIGVLFSKKQAINVIENV